MKNITTLYLRLYVYPILICLFAVVVGFGLPELTLEMRADSEEVAHHTAFGGGWQMLLCVMNCAGLGISLFLRTATTTVKGMRKSANVICIAEAFIVVAAVCPVFDMIEYFRNDGLHITMLTAAVIAAAISVFRLVLAFRCYPAVPFGLPYGNNYRGLPEGEDDDEYEED